MLLQVHSRIAAMLSKFQGEGHSARYSVLLIYFVSTFSTVAISFFSTPLLIRTLEIREFGRWALVEPFQMVLSQSMLLGVNHGVIKALNLDKFILSKTFRRLGVAAQPALVLFSVAGGGVLSGIGFSPGEAVLFGAVCYFEATLLFILYTFRGGHLAYGYSVGSVTRSLVFLALLALDGTEWIGGYRVDRLVDVLFIRWIAASAGVLAGLSVGMRERRSLKEEVFDIPGRWDLYRDSIRYGMPLMVTGLLTMVVTYADRYVLKQYFDYRSLVEYVVHLKIAAVLNPMIMAPFSIWWPTERFRRMEDPDGGSSFFRRLTYLLLASYLFVGGGIWLFSPWIIRWFAPDIPLQPWILLVLICSMVFMGMGPPMNVGLLNKGKTHLNIYAVLVGAIFQLAACLLVIPRYGALGAAAATALSFLFYTGILNYISQKVYRVPFAYGSMALIFSLGVFLMVGLHHWLAPDRFLDCMASSIGYGILFAISSYGVYRAGVLE
jgi:O-antigen/teichoic acid export membrane protein